MSRSSAAAGLRMMVAATFVLAVQDALSRHLAEAYNVFFVVMVRYWFFAAFVIAIGIRQAGGLGAAASTRRPFLQVARGLLLALEICVAVTAFVLLGLVESHALFATYPLIVAALSGVLLGERVGAWRWAAIGLGFIGVVIILRPGAGVFAPAAILPLASALMFALYGLLTRLASRDDPPAVSFFWTGLVGAFAMTAVGVWHIEPVAGRDLVLLAALCVSGVLGHWLLIRAYDLAEAVAVQPLAYLQLVFAAGFGVTVFGEVIQPAVALGAAIVVAAGAFTLWREARLSSPGPARSEG